MSDRVALVTGAAGEMGHALVPALLERGIGVVAADLRPLDPALARSCVECADASILDAHAMQRLFERHRFTHVFHLAAVLSTSAERDPERAHRVNVEGTFGLFRLCLEQGRATGEASRVMFPSSIAVYGLPDARTKAAHGPVRESEWLEPAGMYGCNKLYCEHVGNYLARRRDGTGRPPLDFRSIRFPGLVSAETLPTGGTTDYAPEMIHAAARGVPYACFVRADSRLPFMTMPDAIAALLRLGEADARSLSRRVYNIRGFSVSAGEIRDEVLRHFPQARITFEPAAVRQAIVDSWPADLDDSAARADWGFEPRHGFEDAVARYLVPALRAQYAGSS